MPSDTGEEGATPPLPKSKQERIRDNQRRSRARRQEYLAELERRLAECQLTCREADIQRTAFLELQIENTRLRELLALADVNEQFVQQYVSQAVAQSRQLQQDPNSALRQIKPKIPSPDSQLPQTAPVPPALQNRLPSRVSNLPPPTSSPVPSIGMSDDTLSPQLPSSYGTSAPYTTNPSAGLNAQPNYAWPYSQSQPAIPSIPPQPFRCSTFGVQINQPSRIAGEGSVLCTVAKQMLDQHNLSDVEWQQIKAKLANGFCRPARPGANCGIDNHVLFQILQQLNNRYS